MTAAVTSISRPPAPRWMVFALLVSVALNLVVVGITAASLWRYRLASDLAGAPHVAPNLLGYASTLPSERRKLLWARTEDERRIVRPLRRELREARLDLLKVLSAETFDVPQFEVARARLLTADLKAREAVYKLYGDIAASLTSQERQGYMRWRDKRRPMRNMLDDSDQQANDRSR
jgi:uncharacterized membrane protein